MKKSAQTSSLTPVALRNILAGALAVATILHIVVIVAGYKLLNKTSVEVVSAVNKSEKLAQEIRQLETAKSVLKKKEKTFELSQKLVAQVKDYSYQKEIIYDAIAYGEKVGVSIDSFAFNSKSPGIATGSTSANSKATKKPTGSPVTGHPVTISLRSPIDYVSYLRFLKYLETNLTQIHLKGISLSLAEKTPQSVDTQPLELEVFTK